MGPQRHHGAMGRVADMVTVATAGTESRDITPRNRLNGPAGEVAMFAMAHTAFVVQNVPMRLRRSSILLALLIAAACDRNKGTVTARTMTMHSTSNQFLSSS